MSEQVYRYITAIAALLVVAVIFLVIGVAVYRGQDFASANIVGLLATVATLVGLVTALLRTGQVASMAGRIEEKVNGHLASHVGHTDDQVQELIRTEMRRAGLVASPPAPDERSAP
jgi:hypothetical protein